MFQHRVQLLGWADNCVLLGMFHTPIAYCAVIFNARISTWVPFSREISVLLCGMSKNKKLEGHSVERRYL